MTGSAAPEERPDSHTKPEIDGQPGSTTAAAAAVVIAIDEVLKCALPGALYRRCRCRKSCCSSSSSSSTGEIVISSMSIAAISWSDDQSSSSRAGCKVKDGTNQSIDRIRSLESAKDFNYWPEASSKWTFDLLLCLSLLLSRRPLAIARWWC